MENKGNVLMQKYDFGRLLGQGNFAKVYHARNLKSGDNVAVKVIDKEKVLKVGLIDQTKREISAMGLVKHRNIVELYEVMATKTKIYFVMEYCKGGELFKKVAKGRLKEDVARKFFQQLICAVDFCHNRGVYHRDLKPENLLLDENGTLKVTDFGLSAVAASRRQDGLFHTACGTPAYTAPEVISRRGYDGAKADIWSCGVILYVLLTGQLPFHDANLMEMYRKISKAEIKFPNTFPPEARRLIVRMLDPNPITRVSISKIMGNPWFKKGLDSKHIRSSPVEKEGLSPINIDAVFGPAEVKRPDFEKLTSLNAFDIISLSTGFDLSGLFVENDQKDEAKFTSIESASVIMSKLEEVAQHLKLKVSKKEGGFFKFERSNEGRNMPLSIDVEIFEISSSFHLVEVNKSCGDAVEYQTIFKQDIKPALKDIVWAWQGEYQFQQQPYLQ